MRARTALIPALVVVTSAAVPAEAVDEPPRGVVVRRLYPGGRGYLAGLKRDDVITSCGGSAIGYPFELKGILERRAVTDLTVPIGVFRAGEPLKLTLVPGSPDFHCERHCDGYRAFIRGPNADARWNDSVKAGYEAFKRGSFREAAEHLVAATGAGLTGDRDVLQDAARAFIFGLQGARSYGSAKAAFELDESDRESVRILYYSCLMSGRFREAAKLAPELPEHRGPASYIYRRISRPDAERRSLSKAATALESFLAAGGRVDRLARPGLGRRPNRLPLRDRKRELSDGHLVELYGDVRYTGGKDRLRDFVFSLEVQIEELPWDAYGRFVLVQVDDERSASLLNVGVDERGRLLLGHHWMEAVGPCEQARPSPEWNELKMVREGARVDGYLNGVCVASTFVPVSAKLKVFASLANGGFRFRNVAVLTRGLGEDGQEEFF